MGMGQKHRYPSVHTTIAANLMDDHAKEKGLSMIFSIGFSSIPGYSHFDWYVG